MRLRPVFRLWLAAATLAALVVLNVHCTDPVRQVQIHTADAVADGANAALPILVERYRAAGLAIVAKAETRAEAEALLVVLDGRWNGVWKAWEALRLAQGAWADALESGSDAAAALEAMKTAYCGLREVWPDDVPAVPLVPVKCPEAP